MPRALRLGALAGVIAPPMFVAVLILLTFSELSFLHRVGWSPVRRSTVEWPSLLALGHVGWVETGLFVVGGILGLAFAAALFEACSNTPVRVGSGFVGLMSVAIALEAFKADFPGTTAPASWHDRIHNSVYPVVPLSSLAATALISWGLWTAATWRLESRASLALLAVMLVALVFTSVAAVAQLARYFYFGSLLLWVEVLALGLLFHVRWRVTEGASSSAASLGRTSFGP